MPASPPARSVWSVADIEVLPRDGQRFEVLHGELLVTPSPAFRHQRAAIELAVLFRTASGEGYPVSVSAPGVIQISNTTQLEPDLVVYAIAPTARPVWQELPPPLLAVEFGSPSTQATDRHRKRPAYLAAGIPEVWTIDLEARLIERWTSASEFPTVERADFDFALSAAHAALRVSMQAIFGDA
ncbi:MAG: Uma2 family endonuclease [Gemmatimonadaceae bacterium]|nr:Uma2 family endonuclease [Gemmatimonadaceae bacterium]